MEACEHGMDVLSFCILQQLAMPRQILGDTVTKGSVYVLFDEGNKSKWVRYLATSAANRPGIQVERPQTRKTDTDAAAADDDDDDDDAMMQ